MITDSIEECERLIRNYKVRNKKIDTEWKYNQERIAIIEQHLLGLKETQT